MSTVAATFELGTHPATALLLGGLATAFLREGLPQRFLYSPSFWSVSSS